MMIRGVGDLEGGGYDYDGIRSWQHWVALGVCIRKEQRVGLAFIVHRFVESAVGNMRACEPFKTVKRIWDRTCAMKTVC